MDSSSLENKVKPENLTLVPRMMGDADVALITAFAEGLGPDACLLEIGPWLGGISKILSGFGHLHVVDRFEWSEANAKSHPGIAKPGASFRNAFEKNVGAASARITIHETDLREFNWTDGPIDLCLIDAPRKAGALLDCLSKLSEPLGQQSIILFKNGYNPDFVELPAILEILAGCGILTLCNTDQPKWCNICAAKPGPRWSDIRNVVITNDLWAQTSLRPETLDPWGGALLAITRVAERIHADDRTGTLRRISELPRRAGLLLDWDLVAKTLPESRQSALSTSILNELVSVQTDPVASSHLSQMPNRSTVSALRMYWANTASSSRQIDDFDPKLLATAVQSGAMTLPEAIRDQIAGKSVVEIGEHLGHSGAGFIMFGVVSYRGVHFGPSSREMLTTEARLCTVNYVQAEVFDVNAFNDSDVVVVHWDVRQRPEVVLWKRHLSKSATVLTVRFDSRDNSYRVVV